MCSAIFFRITDIGTTVPGAGALRAGAGVDGLAGVAGTAADETASDAEPPRKLMMSLFVTRPAMPLPWIPEISTLCSFAILRTSGDER